MPHHGFIPSTEEDLLRRRVKAELRKRMRALRNTTPASAIAERSARIVDRLSSLDPIRSARAVALFWPIESRHEVDLRALDAALRARGVRVAYPAIDASTHVMTFRFVDGEPAAMSEQGLGFSEPAPTDPECARDALSAVVVPALAIDPAGHRIGYGAGYYDRTLPRFSPPAVTVGVAFDFQLVPEVPVTDADVALAWIVTDARAAHAGEEV